MKKNLKEKLFWRIFAIKNNISVHSPLHPELILRNLLTQKQSVLIGILTRIFP